MNTQDFGFMLMGVLIILFFTYMAWHPNNNNYVSQEDYDKLNRSYVTLQQEHEALKEDMAKLILEYYGKSSLTNLLGAGKYRLTICALQKYLIGDLPVIKEIC